MSSMTPGLELGVDERARMVDHAALAMEHLADAAGMAMRRAEVAQVVFELMEPWGRLRIGELGGWKSDVADDGSPYEYSMVLGGSEPEVRILLESQSGSGSLAQQWQAALASCERMKSAFGASHERLQQVQDLFSPSSSATEEKAFGMWHSAVVRGEQAVECKVYLDAHARGAERARALIEEALVRLGFKHAYLSMLAGPLARAASLDDVRYLSLDLSCAPSARVKVYVRHSNATIDDIPRIIGAKDALSKTGPIFASAMLGGGRRFDRRPLFSCHAFVQENAWGAQGRTLYVPVESYAGSDVEIATRLTSYLMSREIDPEPYLKAKASMSNLGASMAREDRHRGLHSYVGLREEASGPRVTVYFSPNVLDGRPSHSMPHTLPLPAQEIVNRYENVEVLADHPFLVRLAREPVDVGKLWLVMANFWHGVVHDFPKRLSHIVAKVDDDRIRCIVTKQLHDELGEGDFEKAHKAMFEFLVQSLVPFRLPGDDMLLLAPGKVFSQRLGSSIYASDAYESIGALMLIEIYGKQVDMLMATQFRRQNQVDMAALKWLHLHENLEQDHADDSLKLADLIPQSELAAAWKGAQAVVDASREYFDSLYQLAYR